MGRDKQHRPVQFERLGEFVASGNARLLDIDEWVKLYTWDLETTFAEMRAAAELSKMPVSRYVYFGDLAGVASNWREVWRAIPLLSKLTKAVESHYPEIVGLVVLFNAPGLFARVYNFVARTFLDPATAAKVAVAEYNLAQAAAKREREAAAQKSELQDNIEEIQNNLAGDMLTENPAVGRSFLAPNRVRPDHYKGMSPAEQEAIVAAQAAQRTQKLATTMASKAEDAATDAHMEATRKAGAYQDAQVAAMRAEMRAKIMEDNQVIAKQQYATKAFLNEKVFKNAVDASFFDQFGTSSR